MTRFLLLAALVAAFPLRAVAQDKAMEAVCGQLFGARQTAIRMRDGGFAPQIAINETLARPEWKNASMQHQQLALRVVQEAYFAPQLQSVMDGDLDEFIKGYLMNFSAHPGR